MFGIGNQSNNSDNSDNSKTSLQQSSSNNKKKESNTDALHRHATNALVGINNFMANANRKQRSNQNSQTGSTTISEKKRKAIEAETKKIETFAEHTFVTIGKVLLYSSFGVDFMMFSEYYNKNNQMQGISVNQYPYVEEHATKPHKGSTLHTGLFSSKHSREESAKTGKANWRQKTDRMLLGYRDSWQAPWKNKATMEYPNVSNWGLGKWMMFFATKVSANVVALSRYSLFKTFQISSRIWNPKNILINLIYLLSGWVIYKIVFKGLILTGVWGGLLTLIFVIMKASIITKNWNLFAPSEDPEEEPVFVSWGKDFLDGGAKFFILFGLFFALFALNTFYTSGAFAFMFMLTPFMGDFVRGGDKGSKYNFRKRFVELMWKNKMLISLFCLIFITVDAYKYLGKDAGYVFTGVTVGLFLGFIYKLIRG
jgi:hypothetical protein